MPSPYRLHIIAGMLGDDTAHDIFGLAESPHLSRDHRYGALAEIRTWITAASCWRWDWWLIPVLSGGIRIIQRKLNVSIGEGVIYDLRVALYHHLQQMSLRFFTNTRTGELMSRLNNDVVGAQNAISNTIVNYCH